MNASRLEGLDPTTTRQLVRTAQALELGRVNEAANQLAPVLAAFPEHPEVLRLHAGILNLRGDFAGARAAAEYAVGARPNDALYHNTLGSVLGTAGDFDGAIRVLRRATELQPDLADPWYNLGVILTRCVRNQEAEEALRRAVTLAPDNVEARALFGDMLRVRGKVTEAAIYHRKVLSDRPWAGVAWWGLADLRSHALTVADIEPMRAAIRELRASDDDRIATGFALGKLLDELGRFDDSLAALEAANTLARSHRRWNAPGFSNRVTAILTAFTPPPKPATDSSSGHEVVFITGMPRSGTTLVEQILAAHSRVEGAGELPDLPAVLAEESLHCGQAFPGWVPAMQPADWQRLGERYLERTQHWRRRRPLFTDKLPNNWMYVGAIQAMLPGAHVIVCRRNPLETCFSCYRQHLVNNEYSRTAEDLGAFWRDFDRCAAHWLGAHSPHVYQHNYEALQADPEAGIRKLLKACALPFETACLKFYATVRDVHSPSATQVRQPIRRDTMRAPLYGARLDALRAALGLPLFGT